MQNFLDEKINCDIIWINIERHCLKWLMLARKCETRRIWNKGVQNCETIFNQNYRLAEWHTYTFINYKKITVKPLYKLRRIKTIWKNIEG